jgi:hydrogenase-4 component F
MILLGTIFLPLAGALIAWIWPDGKTRPWLLPIVAAGHSLLVLRLGINPPLMIPGAWISLDPIGLILLGSSSVVFLLCGVYGLEYLRQRSERDNRLFVACFLLTLSGASLTAASRHLGLLWVAMEATTLAAAPLIYFKHSDRSLEATWKYLIMGSVGIGLALLGTFFLALAASSVVSGGVALHLDTLLALGPRLSMPWLRGAFILILVGYGVKMGLSPLHFWKPDAYGEAPGMVGAILASVLTACSFIGILRFYQVCVAAGQTDFVSGILIFMGILSLTTAAIFIVSQRDFKRLLAYSSVEHMGILALGIGIGGAGIFAALLHLINNALAKGLLFLTAGNIHRAYGDKTLDHVHGAMRRVPVSAALFLLGFLAITGSPPFGPFVSEFALLNAAATLGHWKIVLVFAALTAVIFIGMASTALSIVQGEAPDEKTTPIHHDRFLMTLAPGVFAAMVLIMGVYIPAWLHADLTRAAALLSQRP